MLPGNGSNPRCFLSAQFHGNQATQALNSGSDLREKMCLDGGVVKRRRWTRRTRKTSVPALNREKYRLSLPHPQTHYQAAQGCLPALGCCSRISSLQQQVQGGEILQGLLLFIGKHLRNNGITSGPTLALPLNDYVNINSLHLLC